MPDVFRSPRGGRKVPFRLNTTLPTFLLSLLLPVLGGQRLHGQESGEYGVFLRVTGNTGATVSEVGQGIEETVQEAGWNLLASFEVSVDPEACDFSARVFVVDWPEHTRAALSQGFHGAFGAPLRIAVFEDEEGVHVATTNPQSLNRTIVAEQGMEEEWRQLTHVLRTTLASGLGQRASQVQYGQFRTKGRIDRTMGVMAGGPFKEKIETVASLPFTENPVDEVMAEIYRGLQERAPGAEWGIRPVYSFAIPEQDVAVIGVTGNEMEARAFGIVGSGSNKRREGMSCPGLDHAPAFPVELVIYRDGDLTKVTVVDEMYRMKMYFEDAGKMKFARNMRMPGSIEDEIRTLVREALNQSP
ncbi:hypothetical protein ACFL3S_11180 [Gemmatimonadota bacterium]